MIKFYGFDQLIFLFVYDDEKCSVLFVKVESLFLILISFVVAVNVVMFGVGYFILLIGYMNLVDVCSVFKELKMIDGLFWFVFIVNVVFSVDGVEVGQCIVLKDFNVEGNLVIVVMDVEGIDVVSDDEIFEMVE